MLLPWSSPKLPTRGHRYDIIRGHCFMKLVHKIPKDFFPNTSITVYNSNNLWPLYEFILETLLLIWFTTSTVAHHLIILLARAQVSRRYAIAMQCIDCSPLTPLSSFGTNTGVSSTQCNALQEIIICIPCIHRCLLNQQFWPNTSVLLPHKSWPVV